ncbi:MAG: hypothetical protein AAF378_12730 [Cyanobacteria bacterium P01_A01_bin.84]
MNQCECDVGELVEVDLFYSLSKKYYPCGLVVSFLGMWMNEVLSVGRVSVG